MAVITAATLVIRDSPPVTASACVAPYDPLGSHLITAFRSEMIERLLIQFAQAMLLFLVVNWIGRHSYGRGYMSMELLPRPDEAPAMNAALRIATPLVFLVLVSAILYHLQLDAWVEQSYMVAVLYVAFRWGFNVAWGRARLMNWVKEVSFGAAIVSSAWLLHNHVIGERLNIFPHPSDIANELWLAIAVFLFYVANQVRFGEAATERRKRSYIISRARYFRSRYGEEIRAATDNDVATSIILAVMIYEEFNRPRIVRAIENVAFRIGRAKTLGLMQVTTTELIDDRESVRRGAARLVAAWKKSLPEARTPYAEWMVKREMLKDYNPDDNYISEVDAISDIILANVYPKTGDKLTPYEPLVGAIGVGD